MTSSEMHSLDIGDPARQPKRSLWQRLVEPPDSVRKPDRRRQARLLASVLVVLIPLTLVGAVTSILFGTPSGLANPGALSAGLSATVLIGAYALSRTPQYRAGAALTVAVLATVPFAVLTVAGSEFLLDGLVWVALPLLLSSFLLPMRGTVALVLANMIGFSLMPLIVPGMNYPGVILPLGYVAVIGGLLMVSARYRTLVERDRQRELEQANIELEATRQDLEQQVSERTDEIARRSAYLEASVEVARETARLADLRELLPEIASLISSHFGFYNTSVYLLDTSGQRAVLRSASSDVGKRLVYRGHQLPLDKTTLIGAAATSGKCRLALDVHPDTLPFDDPGLPYLLSEIALPLRFQNRVIGVIDIHSSVPQGFREEEIAILEGLADQVALGIENSRLLEQTRRAAQALETAYGERTRASWETADTLPTFAYDRAGIVRSEAEIDPATEEALATGQIVEAMGPDDGRSSLVAPLRLPGEQVIGTIMLEETEKDRSWTAEEIELIRAVSDQVALALESARLFEESQRRLQEQTRLFNASLQLAGAPLELDEIAETIARQFMNVLEVPECSLSLLNPQDNTLMAVADLYVTETGEIGRWRESPEPYALRDYPLTAAAMETVRPVVVQAGDPDPDPAEAEYMARFNTSTLVILPLAVKGRVLGIIELESEQEMDFADEELNLAMTLANQAAVTLDNARLFGQTQEALGETEQQARRLALLNELGEELSRAVDITEVLEAGVASACKILDSDRSSVAMLMPAGDSIRVVAVFGEEGQIPIGSVQPLDGTIETAVVERHLVVSHGTENEALGDTRSFLVAPLTSGGRVIGTLNLGSKRADAYSAREEGLMLQVTSLLSSAIENRRLFDEASTRAEELAVLNELAQALTTRLNTDEVLEQTYRGTSRLLDTSNFHVAIHDQETDLISFPFAVTSGERDIWDPRPMANGMIEYILRNRTPVLVEEDLIGWQREHGIERASEGGDRPAQSWLGVPLVIAGQVLGAVVVQSFAASHIYDEHDRGLLVAVASQLAIALQNARLFEEARARADELAVLNELAQVLATRLTVTEVLEETLRGSSRLLDTSNFYVALFDPEANYLSFPLAVEAGERVQYQPREMADGLSEYIIHNREPVLIVEDVAGWLVAHDLAQIGTEALSWMGVPLLIGDQVLGVIGVQSYEEPYTFDEHHLEMLSAIASQTAIALQNAHLFAETQSALAETEALYRASRAIGEASTATEMEQALVDYARASEADAFRIMLLEHDERGQPVYLTMRGGWRSDGQPMQPHGSRVAISDYPLADLLRPDETTSVQDVLNDPRARDAGRALVSDATGMGSFALVPITAGQRWIGMLFVGRLTPSAFKDDFVISYETLAGQAAVAYERMRLFEETQRRAIQLQTAAEVARDAAAILDVNQLLDETVQLISEQFGFYHAGVFLLDEQREYAVLHAASSEGGHRMLERGHRLKVGEVGIVGFVAAANEPRIALDVGEDAVYFDNPDMPYTRSELALPLTFRGQVIGVLDAQSTEPNAFSEEDVASLQTMADQLATAIENARLFSETQGMLEETRELFDASQAIGSASSPAEVNQAILDYVSRTELDVARALLYDLTGEEPTHIVMAEEWSRDSRPLHPYGTRLPTADFALSRFIHPTEAVTIEDIHTDQRVDESVRMIMEVIRLRSFAVIPLTAGRRPIGGLLVGRDTTFTFPEKLVRNLWTLCGQGAIAIEGLRLLEETRRRAQELEAINEMGRTLTSVLDPSVLLRQIADVTKARFGHDFVSIMLVEGSNLVLEDSSTIGSSSERMEPRSAIYDINQPGLITDAARTGEPVLVNDVLSDPRYTTVPQLSATRSELVVPIEVKGIIIGVLDVHSNRPSAYDQTDMLLLQSLASQAGVAIENARLFTDAERTAWRELAAREIMASVQAASDVESILQVAVRGLGKALNAPRATVQLGIQAPGGRPDSADRSGIARPTGSEEEGGNGAGP